MGTAMVRRIKTLITQTHRSFSSQIFISRLSFYTTDEELNRLFSPFGQIKQVSLVRDPRTQRPKGFAFVTFAMESEAQKALEAMNGRIIGGRLIFVEIAKPKPGEEDNAAS
ncbi:hypothetical protein GIB67_040564 [Kingdonia uniflora]|uniref:RRM domain-containing protein n=1 Tax=Kingdonia uniflora TaxID=39325 RepID=A0A7J7L5F8_9MAGN|nr:hypothetical protein GIB67_040564 [Kingdonia uniflora]